MLPVQGITKPTNGNGGGGIVNLWTETAGNLYPTTLSDTVSIGTSTADSQLTIVGNADFPFGQFHLTNMDSNAAGGVDQSNDIGSYINIWVNGSTTPYTDGTDDLYYYPNRSVIENDAGINIMADGGTTDDLITLSNWGTKGVTQPVVGMIVSVDPNKYSPPIDNAGEHSTQATIVEINDDDYLTGTIGMPLSGLIVEDNYGYLTTYRSYDLQGIGPTGAPGDFWINPYGARIGIGTQSPIYEVDIHDLAATGYDIGNSTTGDWFVDNTGNAKFANGHFTGKLTVDGAIDPTWIDLVQQATPGTNPVSGSDRLYFKSDDNLYKLTHAGVETKLNTGGTVTSVSTGAGLSGGTITTTGTLTLDLTHANSWTGQQTFGTSSPIFSTMTSGSVLFAGASGLLTQDNTDFFWDNINKRLGLGLTVASSQLLDLGGAMQFTGVTAPGACTAALAGAGAGNLSNSAYTYKVTFLTNLGETLFGTISNSITVVDHTTNGQMALTGIPTSTNPAVIGRNVYRVYPANGVYYRLTTGTTLADNTTTTYTDNISDATMTAATHMSNILTDGSALGIFSSGTIFMHQRGSKNLFIGAGAGNSTVTNVSQVNLGFGASALAAVTQGSTNTAIGANALALLTTGGSNTAVGSGAGGSITTTSNNCFFGTGSAKMTGNQNQVMGQAAAQSITSGDNNTIIGGFTNATSNIQNNVALGTFAGGFNTQSGLSNNVAIGYLSSIGTANNMSNVTIIGGNSINSGSATASNQLTIMNAIYGTTLDGTGDTISTGKLGFFTKSPNAKVEIFGTTEQLRLSYDASNYQSLTLDSSGNATYALTGSSPTFTFSQNVSVPDMKATTYHVGSTAGIDATVTYVDTLLGAKTLTFSKGILTAQT